MGYPSPGVGIHHLQRFEPSHHCTQQGAVAQATLHLGRRPQATSRHFEPCPNGVIFVDVFLGKEIMWWYGNNISLLMVLAEQTYFGPTNKVCWCGPAQLMLELQKAMFISTHMINTSRRVEVLDGCLTETERWWTKQVGLLPAKKRAFPQGDHWRLNQHWGFFGMDVWPEILVRLSDSSSKRPGTWTT